MKNATTSRPMIDKNGHWSGFVCFFMLCFNKIHQIYRNSLTIYEFGGIIYVYNYVSYIFFYHIIQIM